MNGTVTILLRSVPNILPPGTIASYQQQAALFFTATLRLLIHPPLTEIHTTMLEQQIWHSSGPGVHLRSLQASTNSSNVMMRPLQTLLAVTGRQPRNRTASGILNFDSILQEAVNAHATLFLDYLHNATPLTSREFLMLVQSVSASAPALMVLPTTESPTSLPHSAVQAPPEQAKAVTTGGIIGIAVGGGVIVLLLLLVAAAGIRYHDPSKAREVQPVITPAGPEDFTSNSDAAISVRGPFQTAASVEKHARITAMDSAALVSTPQNQMPEPSSDSFIANAVNVPISSPAHSDAKTSVPEHVPCDSKPSVLHADSRHVEGTKPSRTVITPPGKLGLILDTTAEGPIVHELNPGSPMEGVIFPGDIIVSIDKVDTRAMSAKAMSSIMTETANQSRMFTIVTDNGTGAHYDELLTNNQLPVGGSEQLTSTPTQSEEATPVPVLNQVKVPADTETRVTTDDDSKRESTMDAGNEAESIRQIRTVIAPAGKLGLIVDTTSEGPIVHKLKPDSPMEGLLFPGDIIVSIDNVDTKAMSAIMINTATQKRTLTVVQDDGTGPHYAPPVDVPFRM